MNVKIFKLTDAGIQILLYACFAAKAYANTDPSFDLLLTAYFTIGAYQVISCVVQLFCTEQPLLWGRRFYRKMLLGVFIAGLIMAPMILFYLYILLILSPLMAIFYTIVSFYETKQIIRHEK